MDIFIYLFLFFPVDTRRRFDVLITLFDRYGRWMDVNATSCARWVITTGRSECYKKNKVIETEKCVSFNLKEKLLTISPGLLNSLSNRL